MVELLRYTSATLSSEAWQYQLTTNEFKILINGYAVSKTDNSHRHSSKLKYSGGFIRQNDSISPSA